MVEAHQAETATTTITLHDGKALAFCTHHARTVATQLTQQGQTFDTDPHDS